VNITLPPLNQQPSPAPWLVRSARVDLPALIRDVLAQNPDASVDQVVAQLAQWNVQASGIIVGMWLTKWKASSFVAADDSAKTELKVRITGK
jgi:hypothetical protein